MDETYKAIKVFIDIGDFISAFRLIDSKKFIYKNLAAFWIARGDICLRLEWLEEALESFFCALLIDKKNCEAAEQFKLAYSYEYQRSFVINFLEKKILSENNEEKLLCKYLLIVIYSEFNELDCINPKYFNEPQILENYPDIKYYQSLRTLISEKEDDTSDLYNCLDISNEKKINYQIAKLKILFHYKKYNSLLDIMITFFMLYPELVKLREFIKLYICKSDDIDAFVEILKNKIKSENIDNNRHIYTQFLLGIIFKYLGNDAEFEIISDQILKIKNIKQLRIEYEEIQTLKVVKSQIEIIKNEFCLSNFQNEEFYFWTGIISRKKIFNPPNEVEIEITNRCNNNCKACVLRSPVLGIHRQKAEWVNAEMPYSLVEELVLTLNRMGTKRIRFSGGGEPSLHKDFKKILKLVNRTELRCSHIITNGLLLDEEVIDLLTEGKFDLINISIWGSNSELYRKTHTCRKESDFDLIIENIKKLKKIRLKKMRKNNGFSPRIRISNVIFKDNYNDIENIYALGEKLKVDEVYYSYFIPFFGASEYLLLDKKMTESVALQIRNLFERRRQLENNIQEIKNSPAKYIFKILLYVYKEEFLGLQFNGDLLQIVNNYFVNPRIIADDFLKFLTSVNSDKGYYLSDKKYDFPCYMGWDTARVTPEGYVAPCTSGVWKPVGNIYISDFEKIWFSKKHREFCEKASLSLDKKNDLYFENIGCWRACDDFASRSSINERYEKLNCEFKNKCQKVLDKLYLITDSR